MRDLVYAKQDAYSCNMVFGFICKIYIMVYPVENSYKLEENQLKEAIKHEEYGIMLAIVHEA